MTELFWLTLLGVGVGTFGTLIGAGGGFILVPMLLFLYPTQRPEVIASISLAVVFFNALSGSIQYARMRWIDYRSGVVFALATVPGAVLGAATTQRLPKEAFGLVLGSVIILGSGLVFALARQPAQVREAEDSGSAALALSRGAVTPPIVRQSWRTLLIGAALSVAVGYLASLLGIGGGIIHVPALVFLLGFQVHVATATSHFVLAISSLVGTGTHIYEGTLRGVVPITIALSIGVVAGAQIGARLAVRVNSVLILRSLAVALALVGVRVLWKAIS